MDTIEGPLEPERLFRDTRWLVELCRHLVRDAGAAEDVAQDTWLAAVRAWPRGLPSRSWLAHVARNEARTRHRGETRRRDHESDAAREAARADGSAPDELVARIEMQRRLAACVLALPDPYRSTILWRYVEGRSPREIARRTGVPDATVRSRAARGLEILRTELDRASGGDRRAWLGALAVAGTPSPASTPLSWPLLLLGGSLVTKIVSLVVVSCVLIAAFVLLARGPSPREGSAAIASREPVTDARAADGGPGSAGSTPASAPAVERRAPLAPQPAAAASVELRLRLIDDVSGEAVPHARVGLVTPDGAREVIESDAQGFVHDARLRRATNAALECVLDVSPCDHPSDLVQTNRAARASLVRTVPVSVAPNAGSDVAEAGHATPPEIVDVRVPVGPRWFLAGGLPAGTRAADLTARLTCADPRKAFDKLYALVHDDEEGLWIRFADTSRLLAGGPPWKVFVGSEDGLWAASFTSETIAGTQRTPVVLEFAATARVQGRLLGSDGREHGDEWVQFHRPGSSFRDVTNRPLLVRADAAGRFDARHVPPGEYELRVAATGFWPLSRALTLQGGESIALDLALAPRPTDGSIDVRLTSETGTYAGAVHVRATLEEGQRDTTSQVPEWNGPTASWHLGGLVRSTFTVRASADDGTPIAPEQHTVASDGREVTFVVRDRTPMVELAFRATEAETHGPVTLEGCTVTVIDPSDPKPPTRGVDLATMRTRVPRAERYVVRAHAKGHRPIEVVIAPNGADATEIVLRKGWGMLVTVLDLDRRPLAGARVTCDGVDMGLTDERGVLRVEREAPPRSLFAHLDGWRVADASDTDPRTGAFREWQASTTIRLERVPR